MPQESLNLPYFVLLGAVVITIIVGFTIFKPQIEHMQATKQKNIELAARLTDRQQFLQAIDQKSIQLRANAAAEQELGIILPSDESFDDVLRIVDRQGVAAAVLVKRVDNTTSKVQSSARVAKALGNESDLPDSLTVHGVNISIQGSYQQIRQFVSLMENAVRFMDISTLTLSAPKEGGEIVDAVLTANFYSLSPKK